MQYTPSIFKNIRQPLNLTHNLYNGVISLDVKLIKPHNSTLYMLKLNIASTQISNKYSSFFIHYKLLGAELANELDLKDYSTMIIDTLVNAGNALFYHKNENVESVISNRNENKIILCLVNII